MNTPKAKRKDSMEKAAGKSSVVKRSTSKRKSRSRRKQKNTDYFTVKGARQYLNNQGFRTGKIRDSKKRIIKALKQQTSVREKEEKDRRKR